MSFMYAHGYCVACGTFMSFNPHKVPSLRIKGEREPICLHCFTRWNELNRTNKGLPEGPLNDGAYEPLEVM